jgi:hypothetical protein
MEPASGSNRLLWVKTSTSTEQLEILRNTLHSAPDSGGSLELYTVARLTTG